MVLFSMNFEYSKYTYIIMSDTHLFVVYFIIFFQDFRILVRRGLDRDRVTVAIDPSMQSKGYFLITRFGSALYKPPMAGRF